MITFVSILLWLSIFESFQIINVSLKETLDIIHLALNFLQHAEVIQDPVIFESIWRKRISLCVLHTIDGHPQHGPNTTN